MVYPTKKLGDVCYITDGSHFSPSTIERGYPYITVTDVSWNGEIDFTHCKFISEKSYWELVKNGCKPEKGDVLFSKDGTVGKVAVVQTDKEFVVLSSLAILRPSKELDSNFLYWAMQAPDFFEYAIGSKTGAALKRVVLRVIKTFEIPLPPIAEQKKIVKKLDALSEKVRTLQELQSAQSADLKALKQSILHDAFTQPH